MSVVKSAMLRSAIGDNSYEEVNFTTDSKGKRTETGGKVVKGKMDVSAQRSFLQLYGEFDEAQHIKLEHIAPNSGKLTSDEWLATHAKKVDESKED